MDHSEGMADLWTNPDLMCGYVGRLATLAHVPAMGADDRRSSPVETGALDRRSRARVRIHVE